MAPSPSIGGCRLNKTVRGLTMNGVEHVYMNVRTDASSSGEEGERL